MFNTVPTYIVSKNKKEREQEVAFIYWNYIFFKKEVK